VIVVAVAHLLVAGAALAKIMPLDDAGILEQFDRPINRRDRDLVVDRDAAAIQFLDVGMVGGLRQHAGDDAALFGHAHAGGGAAGFDADWVSTSQQMETEYRVEVQPFETDGLSFTFPGERERSVKFDGKDHPNPNPAVKMVTSAQRVNATSVVLTDKFGDRVIDTQEIGVSTDGKTLTIIRHVSGRTEPDLFVFERN